MVVLQHCLLLASGEAPWVDESIMEQCFKRRGVDRPCFAGCGTGCAGSARDAEAELKAVVCRMIGLRSEKHFKFEASLPLLLVLL